MKDDVLDAISNALMLLGGAVQTLYREDDGVIIRYDGDIYRVTAEKMTLKPADKPQ